MSDLTDRLRRWAISTDAAPASDLMDEAAAEIERLRLTDEERSAVKWAAKQMQYIRADNAAATLRGLLERMK